METYGKLAVSDHECMLEINAEITWLLGLFFVFKPNFGLLQLTMFFLSG